MASIENKSRYVVTVKGSELRTCTFSHSRLADVKDYIAELKAADLKPQVHRTNDSYVIRVRERGHVTQTLTASSEQKAVDIKPASSSSDVAACSSTTPRAGDSASPTSSFAT